MSVGLIISLVVGCVYFHSPSSSDAATPDASSCLSSTGGPQYCQPDVFSDVITLPFVTLATDSECGVNGLDRYRALGPTGIVANDICQNSSMSPLGIGNIRSRLPRDLWQSKTLPTPSTPVTVTLSVPNPMYPSLLRIKFGRAVPARMLIKLRSLISGQLEHVRTYSRSCTGQPLPCTELSDSDLILDVPLANLSLLASLPQSSLRRQIHLKYLTDRLGLVFEEVGYPPQIDINTDVLPPRWYYYSIDYMELTALCGCNGHASSCSSVTGTCACEHFTGGPDCSQCLANFSALAWQEATPGSARSCQDTNECQSTPAVCAAGASCQNSVGSFSCQCPTGSLCYQCALGFMVDRQARCINIDECQLNASICGDPATTQCQDTRGSFSCGCQSEQATYIMESRQCVTPTTIPVTTPATTNMPTSMLPTSSSSSTADSITSPSPLSATPSPSASVMSSSSVSLPFSLSASSPSFTPSFPSSSLSSVTSASSTSPLSSAFPTSRMPTSAAPTSPLLSSAASQTASAPTDVPTAAITTSSPASDLSSSNMAISTSVVSSEPITVLATSSEQPMSMTSSVLESSPLQSTSARSVSPAPSSSSSNVAVTTLAQTPLSQTSVAQPRDVTGASTETTSLAGLSTDASTSVVSPESSTVLTGATGSVGTSAVDTSTTDDISLDNSTDVASVSRSSSALSSFPPAQETTTVAHSSPADNGSGTDGSSSGLQTKHIVAIVVTAALLSSALVVCITVLLVQRHRRRKRWWLYGDYDNLHSPTSILFEASSSGELRTSMMPSHFQFASPKEEERTVRRGLSKDDSVVAVFSGSTVAIAPESSEMEETDMQEGMSLATGTETVSFLNNAAFNNLSIVPAHSEISIVEQEPEEEEAARPDLVQNGNLMRSSTPNNTDDTDGLRHQDSFSSASHIAPENTGANHSVQQLRNGRSENDIDALVSAVKPPALLKRGKINSRRQRQEAKANRRHSGDSSVFQGEVDVVRNDHIFMEARARRLTHLSLDLGVHIDLASSDPSLCTPHADALPFAVRTPP